ncbi:MAG: ABC transporter permease [Planctomycetota bacterium]|nr:ABC transporter permease [Planctomycetota bacterium]
MTERRIEPSCGWNALHLSEVWVHRELLFFLTWRDIRVRYKQTVLGAAWAVIQPLATMVIFSIFFGRLGKIPPAGVPYPLFAFTALVPWTLFAYSLTQSSNSLVGSAALLKKVYFPRLLIPLASIMSGLVDFLIAFVVLLGLMFFYGLTPTLNLLYLPLFVALAMTAAASVGLFLAAINVRYRDIRYTIPFLTQLWLFATPIAYPSTLIPEKWRALYGLNPMAGVVEGFRWSLLGTDTQPGSQILVSAAVTVLLLLFSLSYFRRAEREFADIV